MEERVKKALEKVRPYLQRDGGDIELVEVNEDDGIVKVRLTGMCYGCAMASVTLTQGVEQIVKEEVPEIKKVVAV